MSMSENTTSRSTKYYTVKTDQSGELVAFSNIGSNANAPNAPNNPLYLNVDSIDEGNLEDEENKRTSRISNSNNQQIPSFDNPIYSETLGIPTEVPKFETNEETNRKRTSTLNTDTYEDLNKYSKPARDLEYVIRQEKYIDLLTNTLCLIYVILTITLGIVAYIVDVYREVFAHENTDIAEYYNLYLLIVQFFWMLFLHIDVTRFKKFVNQKLQKARENSMKQGTQMVSLKPGCAKKDEGHSIIIPEHYGYIVGRHAGSNFLKIGSICELFIF